VLRSAEGQLKGCGITALGLQGDVRKQEDCQRWAATTADQLGSLDILVNCAAGACSSWQEVARCRICDLQSSLQRLHILHTQA
jgi:NAD(P)-dependent dehydrogenase (short-subunit alcohol dehydrogenase family)